MVVAFPQLSLDVYIALSLVLATPWLYSVFTSTSTTKTSKTLSTLLLLHTLYLLHALLVSPPPNIFKSLGLPVNIPSEYLQAKLLEVYGERNIPTHLASLPKRLGLMELRSLYVRYVSFQIRLPSPIPLTVHVGLGMKSLQAVPIANRLMIMPSTQYPHLSWNIHVKLLLSG